AGETDAAAMTVVPAASAGHDEGYVGTARISVRDEEAGRGPAGSAVRERRHQFSNDIGTDPAMAPWREKALERGYRSVFCCPLFLKGEAVAVLSLYSGETDFFKGEEIELLDHIAGDLSYALEVIDNARIREEKEAELRLKDIVFETSVAANVIADAAGFITQVNRSALDLWGYAEAADVKGRPLRSFIREPAIAAEVARQVVETGRWVGEYEAVRKDGSLFTALAMATIIRDASGAFIGFQSSVLDVTERRRSQERIRELTQALEQSTASIVISDLQGSIVYVNEALAHNSGYTAEELLGRNVESLGSGAETGASRAMWRELAEGRTWTGEFRNRRKDGSLYWVAAVIGPVRDEHGAMTRYIAVMNDISDQKRLIDALERSEREYRELFESSIDAVYKSTHDGKFIDVNTAMVRLLGYESKLELMNVHIPTALYFKESDRDVPAAALLRGEETVYALRRKDGTPVWVEDHGRYVHDAEGNILFHEGILRDVTERKKAEEALRDQQAIYAAIFENANESIALLDPDTGEFTSFNETAHRSLGYTREEFQRLRLHDIKVGMPAERIVGYLQGMADEGGAVFESMHRHKDGSVRLRSISSRTVTIAGRRYIASIWSDITERKKSEHKIRQLSQAVEQLASTVVITDTHGTIEYVNRAFVRTTGYTPEEVIGKKPSVLKSGYTTGAEYAAMWDTITAGQVWQGEFHNKRKDGTLYWELAVIAPVQDEHGAVTNFVAVKEDITQRKAAEQELKMKESAIASSINAIAFADLAGRLTSINRAFLDLWGYGHEGEVLGREVTEFWRMGEQASAVMTALGERGNWSGELTAVRKDGEVIDVLISASMVYDKENRPLCMMGSFIDITSRKRSEATVRQLSLAVQQASVSVVITDTRGVVQYVNEAAVRTSGYSAAEMIGRTPSLLKSGETPPGVYEELWRTIAAGGQWRGEFRNKRKDGRLYWESVVIAPVKDDAGAIVNYMAVKEDITERREMQQQLLRSQRMESIGTLAGGIAHDLNNILGPILLSVQVLRMKVKDETLTTLLNTIESSTLRGKNIVAQVLGFARGTDSKPVLMQVRHLVREVEEIIKQTFAKSIDIESYAPKDLWTVSADPTQVHQVLMNLCVNARDAMPQGGRLSVTVKNTVVDEALAAVHPGAAVGRYIEIEVRDTGTGIPADIQQKIFDPFFTTKELGKGTGLGLSTIYTIVKQHKGFIRLDSAVGTGTSFHVYLPASAESGAAESGPAEREFERGHHEAVLVIDDELSVRKACEQTLEVYDYTVATAGNGAEGISKFIQGGTVYRVVLIDMMMPVMDGRTAAAAIRKIDPTVRIVGMSGLMNDAPEPADGGLFDRFLRKPFSGRELMAAVQAAFGGTNGD
ncbi:MAG: PAS domain S-box protein, partial [Bacteroidetes bacterium]